MIFNTRIIDTAGIIKNLENFQKRDSALELDGIEALEINLV